MRALCLYEVHPVGRGPTSSPEWLFLSKCSPRRGGQTRQFIGKCTWRHIGHWVGEGCPGSEAFLTRWAISAHERYAEISESGGVTPHTLNPGTMWNDNKYLPFYPVTNYKQVFFSFSWMESSNRRNGICQSMWRVDQHALDLWTDYFSRAWGYCVFRVLTATRSLRKVDSVHWTGKAMHLELQSSDLRPSEFKYLVATLRNEGEVRSKFRKVLRRTNCISVLAN